MKILIIRFSSIGDIVLTTPVFRNIKKKYPNSEIHFLTKKKFEFLLSANPNIDRIIGFEGDLRDLVFDLLKLKYDYVLDLHNNYRTAYIKSILRQAYNTNVVIRSVNKLNFKKLLYAKLKINIMPSQSIVERYLNAAKVLDVRNDGQGLDYHIPDEALIDAKDLPLSHSAGYISFVIGGAHNTKKMPLEKWMALCNLVQYPIIIQGGEEDAALGQQLHQLDPIRIYNSCGKFSLHESADIIRYAKVVVTHDTGLMHIAAAFKRNIVAIWGNTTPWLGMFPYFGFNDLKNNIAPNLVHIQKEKLRCRPCSKIGYKSCPKKHFNCMNQLDVMNIKSAIELFLKQPS